jgi:hypothetical protein
MITTTSIVAAATLIALALALGCVAAVERHHHRFMRSSESFTCKVRPAPDAAAAGRRRRRQWPRRRDRALWAHDVLLVQRGRLFPHITALTARFPEDAIRDTEPGEVRRLGRDPLVMRLRLDDGQLVDIAAPRQDRTRLAGPFLAAAIPGLPGGRKERPNLGR